jgi:hypothetical protein
MKMKKLFFKNQLIVQKQSHISPNDFGSNFMIFYWSQNYTREEPLTSINVGVVYFGIYSFKKYYSNKKLKEVNIGANLNYNAVFLDVL